MQKIPTLFVRDPQDPRKLTDEIHPDCQWVLDGEGITTRKYDGTCVMLDEEGKWWARREVKSGKAPPSNFVQLNYDQTTGKTVGWEPIEQSPFTKFHAEALKYDEFENDTDYKEGESVFSPGTYELVGPKINGNPEKVEHHTLIRHSDAQVLEPRNGSSPRSIEIIKNFVKLSMPALGYEGVVWHHPDGRMAKLKVKDL